MTKEIGCKVRIKAFAFPEYIEKKRIWSKKKTYKIGWYVGLAYKQEGIYNSGDSHPLLGPIGQPYLTKIKTIKLLRIKLSDHSNDKFAFPEDVDFIKKGK